MERHTFLQELDDRGVLERGRRAEWDGPRRGWVVDAAYLNRTPAPIGFLRRLWGARPKPGLRVRLPFDEEGRDTLGLFEANLPELEPGAVPSDGARVVRGTVSSVSRTEGFVLQDFWLEEPRFFRILQMEDFVVTDEEGEPVVVSAGLAPLVVARPRPATLGDYVEPVSGLSMPSLPADSRGWSLSVEVGAAVEVLGVARPIETSERRVLFEDWAPAYRQAPRRLERVIGDEDGTRLVIGVP